MRGGEPPYGPVLSAVGTFGNFEIFSSNGTTPPPFHPQDGVGFFPSTFLKPSQIVERRDNMTTRRRDEMTQWHTDASGVKREFHSRDQTPPSDHRDPDVSHMMIISNLRRRAFVAVDLVLALVLVLVVVVVVVRVLVLPSRTVCCCCSSTDLVVPRPCGVGEVMSIVNFILRRTGWE